MTKVAPLNPSVLAISLSIIPAVVSCMANANTDDAGVAGSLLAPSQLVAEPLTALTEGVANQLNNLEGHSADQEKLDIAVPNTMVSAKSEAAKSQIRVKQKRSDNGQLMAEGNLRDNDKPTDNPRRSKKTSATELTTKYDIEKLQKNPVLFDKTLNQAISAKDWQSVIQLLPYYRALASSDPTLIRFAEASIEQSQNKFKPIILLYQEQLLDEPDNYQVRLNLAQALQADKQFTEAKSQLLLLQAAEIPKAIGIKAERALASIHKSEAWRFNVRTNLVIDPNINDAPPKYIQDRYGKVIEQEAGSDISLSASAHKRFNLPKHYYATVGSNVFLDGFWQDDDKINYLLTGSAGIGYNDPKNDWTLTPSITKRIYDDTSYSQRQALNLRGSRWIGKRIRVNATATWSEETFDRDISDKRKTDNRYIGLTGLYVMGAKGSLVATIGHQQTDQPNSASSNSEYNTFRLGWNKQWGNNLSTAVTASYTVKDYANPALRYSDSSLSAAQEAALARYYNSVGGKFGELRQDRISALNLQLWKRDFTWHGVTPKLSLKYSQTASNFDYYEDRNEQSATVILSRSF